MLNIVNRKLDYSTVHDKHWLFATCNSFVRKDGCLVMGRGAALEVKSLYPELPRMLALEVEHLGTYGLIWLQQEHVGVFQVKRHFRDKADLNLIYISAKMLALFAQIQHDKEIHMNFPGIGNGRLKYNDVEKELLCAGLGDKSNVYLYV